MAEDSDNRQFVTEMIRAYNERRFADYADAFTEDAEITYPQSGEAIPGRDNIRGMMEAFPSPPTFTIREVTAAGEVAVVEADADYGQGDPWRAVIIYRIRGGRVTGETAYFGAPFEAADWRAPFRRS